MAGGWEAGRLGTGAAGTLACFPLSDPETLRPPPAAPSHHRARARALGQVFGRRYYEQMPGMGLRSADAAYVLAFSVIMLNTDLHNTQVRGRGRAGHLGALGMGSVAPGARGLPSRRRAPCLPVAAPRTLRAAAPCHLTAVARNKEKGTSPGQPPPSWVQCHPARRPLDRRRTRRR